MKHIYLILFFAACFFGVNAQDMPICIPDSTLSDSVVVIPLPYDSINRPDGGIQDTAFLNQPYSTVVSVRIPSRIEGQIFTINSVELDTEGAITPLPEGLAYTCDPPDCKFPADSSGCIVISGTPTNPMDTLTPFDLSIRFTIRSLIGIPVTFPDDGTGILPESAAGNYFLFVKGSAGPVSSTKSYFQDNLTLSVQPNPVWDQATINIQSKVTETVDFRVFDFTGKMVDNRRVDLITGGNTVLFDAGNLPNGMYLYSFSNAKGAISERMIIQR